MFSKRIPERVTGRISCFVKNMKDPLKDEYLLSVIVDGMLKKGTEFVVLPTNDMWFGVTYQEDKASMVEGFRKLYEEGVYQEELFGDVRKEKV